MLNLKSYEVVKESKNNDYLVTIAIGETFYERFKNNAFETWNSYAEIHGFGIIVFYDDLIGQDHIKWKKPTWQKLLIGSVLVNSGLRINRICYLDTDIIINPYSPNIFKKHVDGKISVVSARRNLPFNYDHALRKLALLRRKYSDPNYPIDSSLFANLKTVYEYQNLPVQYDEFCAGLLMFSPSELAEKMEEWFYLYEKDTKSITSGGDQTHLNYHVLSSNLANFLEYEFQAIWAVEAANFYPFLFADGFKDIRLYEECVQSTLLRVHFLHFAGSWPESSTFNLNKFSISSAYLELYEQYFEYLKVQLTGTPLGKVLPDHSRNSD